MSLLERTDDLEGLVPSAVAMQHDTPRPLPAMNLAIGLEATLEQQPQAFVGDPLPRLCFGQLPAELGSVAGEKKGKTRYSLMNTTQVEPQKEIRLTRHVLDGATNTPPPLLNTPAARLL